MRGLPENRRFVGPSKDVPGLRPCGLLRFLAQSARNRAFSPDGSSDRPVSRARRRLALVLRGQRLSITRITFLLSKPAAGRTRSLSRASLTHLRLTAFGRRMECALRENLRNQTQD